MSGTRDQGEVRSVVIPTSAEDLLLPSAAVAEVTAFQDPEPFRSAPDWLLGTVNWRGCRVPLVALGQADAETVELTLAQRSRLIICYTPNGNTALPYLGILARGSPRLARMSAQTLVPLQIEIADPFVLHRLTYQGRPAFIPDMDAIERAVQEAIES